MKSGAMALDSTEPKPGEAGGPRGRILIVDDEEVIASTLKEFLEGENFLVVTAQDLRTAVAQVESFEPEIVLCDVQLPGADGISVLNRVLQIRPDTLFVMITAYATVENAVSAFQRSAHDYLIKPVLFEDLLAKIDRLIRYRRLLQENQALERQLHTKAELDELVGESASIQAVKKLMRKVGPTHTTVLITGESGTGKELVARGLHALGLGRDEIFLAVNCAAIPHDLLENQLFGHVRAPSRERIATRQGSSSRPDGALSFSTKSASSHGRRKPSSCGRSKTRKCCRWGRHGPFRFEPDC